MFSPCLQYTQIQNIIGSLNIAHRLRLFGMLPTGTGKRGKLGKWEGIFQSGNFCQDWKSWGILLKYWKNEKKLYWKIEKNTGKVRKFVSQ